MHYRLPHPGQGILDPAPAIYSSQPITLPSAFCIMSPQDPTWHMDTGVDFDETFSPVVKPATVRTVLSLAVSRKWPIHQLDVKNAFLNGDLSETVYMYQPPGFVDNRYPHHVCLLQRSLYGLKQAPRAWFQRFAGYATRAGFYHSRCDSSLFIYRQGPTQVVTLRIYVDESFSQLPVPALLQQIIVSFKYRKKYALQLLERAHMVTCNPSRTPVDIESKLGTDISEITKKQSKTSKHGHENQKSTKRSQRTKAGSKASVK
ncbi:ribonuclease H-like domain-containing protein [Tanacetum coccineum]